MNWTGKKTINTMGDNIYEEMNIVVNISDQSDQPAKAKPFINPKMRISREFVLCCLSAHVKSQPKMMNNKLSCLDAFGASGICGLQWKTKLGDLVHVTLSERDDQSFKGLKENCSRNGFATKDLPLHFTRVPGLPLEEQLANEIHVKQCDANVLMKMESFNFIHLDPFGCTTPYLMSALTNVTNNGVLHVTSTDLGSLYVNHPNVTMRNYGVTVERTEYMRELAVRVVVTAIVRAAAVCHKGIKVLLSLALDHFVTVVVRVLRGPRVADECVRAIQRLVHCRVCAERWFLPVTLPAVVDSHSILSCDCHVYKADSTTMELGPIWSGDIFDREFLELLGQVASQEMSGSVRCRDVIDRLLDEARCSNVNLGSGVEKRETDLQSNCVEEDAPEGSGNKSETDLVTSGSEDLRTENIEKVDRKSDDNETNTSLDKCGEVVRIEQTEKVDRAGVEGLADVGGMKRKSCRQRSHGPPRKGLRVGVVTTHPAFYYDLHRHCGKGGRLAKLDHVVRMLRNHGYRASRTHFCDRAVRTDCNLHELLKLVQKLEVK